MRIGVILTGDYTWAGGLYYSLNIIKLLQRASTTKKITVVVIVNRNTQTELLKEISPQAVEFADLDQKSFFYKAWCKVMGKLSGNNYRFVSDINALQLDALYPVIHYEQGQEKLNCRTVYWLYDFQHKFLPELFTQEEILRRDANFKAITDSAKTIVLSSHDSKKHLLQFYPNCKAELFVYNFVSLIQKGQTLKTQVPENYLVVCNQFWPHKNHLVVLRAMDRLLSANKDIYVVFTGKYDDVRNKDYVNELQEFIREKKLEKHITFTGFIAREEQVAIIEKAKAVIQPSLFEGWSTVIEDAKALNKFLIVSDLGIHREQIRESVHFFDPQDDEKLAAYMYEVFSGTMIQTSADYSVNVEQSSKDLMTLFKIN